DQQQQSGRGQALQQRLEERLRLRIDPVQVFEDQQQRLYLAFAQQHALEGVEGALTPLRRLELLERTVLWEDVQQGEERRERLLQRLVERQHLPGDLGTDGARLIPLLDMRIALEQVNDREIWRSFAIGHRGTFEHQPALGVVGMDNLIGQTRLPYTSLANNRYHLAVTRVGSLKGVPECLEFRLPSDKARQPPCHCRLQAPADAAGADQFKHLHRLGQSPDRDRP